MLLPPHMPPHLCARCAPPAAPDRRLPSDVAAPDRATPNAGQGDHGDLGMEAVSSEAGRPWRVRVSSSGMHGPAPALLRALQLLPPAGGAGPGLNTITQGLAGQCQAGGGGARR